MYKAMNNITIFWVYLKTGLYGLFVYLEIDIDMIKVLGVFLLIDTVSGILKTIRWNFKKFSFTRLLWGVVLKLGILIIPLIVAFLGKGLQYDLGFGVEISIKILILSELFSFAGNFYTLRTGIVLKDIDFISLALLSIRAGAKKQIDKLLKLIESMSGGGFKEKEIQEEEQNQEEDEIER
jgi:hypothetical protein